jgi:S-formylglutathione hydrolase
MSAVEIRAEHRVHGGTLRYCQHDSAATGTPMRFSIWTPDGEGPFPWLIWLSGLTCTEDNFTTKGGAYAHAAEHGLAIVAPDTSPRGEGVPNDDAYDLGQGAGFYVDATQEPWAANFRMESYVTHDLVLAAREVASLDEARLGVFGHSMGGHGALTLALRHPDLFRSVSAFAPIVSPMNCPWGEKAFTAYLGKDHRAWADHDACALIRAGDDVTFDDILIDQGLRDTFLDSQLKPELIEAAAAEAGRKITVRRQPGYDHSYFFILSFIGDHIAWHAERL